jgi:hypothetical protein
LAAVRTGDGFASGVGGKFQVTAAVAALAFDKVVGGHFLFCRKNQSWAKPKICAQRLMN